MATNLESHVQIADVEYQPGFQARIYQPAGSGPFPTVLEVHGGAWNHGDRLSNAGMDQELASRGILIAAIDFHAPPTAGYPASIEDMYLAMTWLRARYGAQKLGLLGTSSGGHMVMLAALRAKAEYVVACWPIVDPLARYAMAKRSGRQELVSAHDAYWRTEDAMREGNPTLILERGETVSLPSALIIQGTNDDNVTPDMAERFTAAYRKRGGNIILEKYEGMPHTFFTKLPKAPETARALNAIEAFIKAQAR